MQADSRAPLLRVTCNLYHDTQTEHLPHLSIFSPAPPIGLILRRTTHDLPSVLHVTCAMIHSPRLAIFSHGPARQRAIGPILRRTTHELPFVLHLTCALIHRPSTFLIEHYLSHPGRYSTVRYTSYRIRRRCGTGCNDPQRLHHVSPPNYSPQGSLGLRPPFRPRPAGTFTGGCNTLVGATGRMEDLAVEDDPVRAHQYPAVCKSSRNKVQGIRHPYSSNSRGRQAIRHHCIAWQIAAATEPSCCI